MGNFAAQRPWVHNGRIAKPGEHEGHGENELSLINWQDFVGENLCIDQLKWYFPTQIWEKTDL